MAIVQVPCIVSGPFWAPRFSRHPTQRGRSAQHGRCMGHPVSCHCAARSACANRHGRILTLGAACALCRESGIPTPRQLPAKQPSTATKTAILSARRLAQVWTHPATSWLI